MYENGTTDDEERVNTLTSEVENRLERSNNGNDTSEEIIDKDTSYCSTSTVSYYADVDADGTVDGIIFADLAVGGSGTSYSYDAVDSSSLKEYTISKTTYTDTYFGEGYIITPATNTTEEDRFYVMALSNTTTSSYSTFYWYYSAYSNEIDDYSTVTSTSFGSGKTNTTTMKVLWNSSTYGSQNSEDTWGLNDVGANVGTSDSIWFIPSLYEWGAFIGTFGITSSNYYSTYGLSATYWTSSLTTNHDAARIDLPFDSYMSIYVLYKSCVRLATTF